jgi:predicted transcriptional regulator
LVAQGLLDCPVEPGNESAWETAIGITKILDQAIAKARTLSDEDQDALGAVVLSLAEDWPKALDHIDEETRSAIREGLAQARRGEFVPEADVGALWKRYRL